MVVKAATVKQLMLYLLNGDVDAAVVGRSGAWKVRDKVDLLPNHFKSQKIGHYPAYGRCLAMNGTMFIKPPNLPYD